MMSAFRVLVTVRPGPVLHLWLDGREVARVPLTPHAALELAAALLREVRARAGTEEMTNDLQARAVADQWDEP
jgi:hypothetical protein